MYLTNSNSGVNSNLIIASPNLGNIAAGTQRVKFFAKSAAAVGSVQVGTVNNTGGNAVFSEVETVAITSTYTEYEVNFTGYIGTDTYIAFRHNSSGTYSSVYLDDIRWEAAPLCADVTSVMVNNISSATANVIWESQGNEANWQVVYGLASTIDPSTLTPSALLTNLNYPINGLTEATTYKAWVRAVCGAPDGDGAWIGPYQFTTQCLAQSVPYSQNFESAVTPALPACSTIQNLSTGNNFITSSLNNFGFTSKVLQYTYSCATTDAADAWYFTKGLTLTAGTEYSIS